MRFFLQPRGELRQAHCDQNIPDPIRIERAGFRGIDDRGLQRTDRKIRPLRQHHQLGFCRDGNRAASERPDAGDGAEQGRFAGAGRAGHQGALVAADAEAVSPDEKLFQIDLVAAGRRHDIDRVCPIGQARGAGDRHLESVEPRHHRAPFRQRAVDRDKKRQRPLHAGEGGCGLHHAAELDLVRKKSRRHQNVGENHRGLRVARGKRRQPLGPLHDGVPVVDNAAEALRKPLPFGALALQ